MNTVVFHAQAREDYLNAAQHYAAQDNELAKRFIAAVANTLDLMRDFPALGLRDASNTRKIFVRKFPYAIIYLVEDERMLVLTIAHQARKPGYWMEGNASK